MILTVTIDDQSLPDFYEAYGIETLFGGPLDDKQKAVALRNTIIERLYAPLKAIKQSRASVLASEAADTEKTSIITITEQKA